MQTKAVNSRYLAKLSSIIATSAVVQIIAVMMNPLPRVTMVARSGSPCPSPL